MNVYEQLQLSEQEIVRRQNMQALREMGIEPYPAAAFPTDAFSVDILAFEGEGVEGDGATFPCEYRLYEECSFLDEIFCLFIEF